MLNIEESTEICIHSMDVDFFISLLFSKYYFCNILFTSCEYLINKVKNVIHLQKKSNFFFWIVKDICM